MVITFKDRRSTPVNSVKGFMLLILVFAVFLITIGLMIAMPVWQTQIQREKEEELIFRGEQYVEAVRLFTQKKPGSFPDSLDSLQKEKCLRRLYKDPMTDHGEWNLILHYRGTTEREGKATEKVLVAPLRALPSLDRPQILGVVSSSTEPSIKIYEDQNRYDQWMFFYGKDPKKMPSIVYYGQKEKDS